MKVYNPKKESSLLAEVLKDIYLLRQSLEHKSNNSEANIKALDQIRKKITKIKDLVEGS